MSSKHRLLACSVILFCLYSHAQNNRGVESIGITEISVIEIAPNGDVWAGSFGQGIAFYDAAQQSWTYYTSSNTPELTSDTIFDIKPAVVGGVQRSYAATAKGVTFSTAGTGWDTLSNLGGGKVLGININNDSIWALRGNALVNFDSSNTFRQSFASPFPAISCVQRSNNACSGLWAGTANNGIFYTSNGISFTFIDTSIANKKLVDNRVTALAVDNNCAAVYVGTQGGFSVCPVSGPPCQNFTSANSSLPQNNISDLIVGCNGQVWLTTRDSGVVVFENQNFTRITTANGLTDNRTTAIGCNIANCSAYVGSPTGDIAVIDSTKNVAAVLSSVRNIKASEPAISVFPVPAKDEVSFSSERELKNVTFELRDIAGQLIVKQYLGTVKTFTTSISPINNGFYFYRIVSEGIPAKTGKLQVVK
ncbi:MAG: T9SS type A sorting domain-containing protein [Chitinophagales bacterium]|nr:T9SS type A sorting domain-containing protein [Chitinophagales bacterium]